MKQLLTWSVVVLLLALSGCSDHSTEPARPSNSQDNISTSAKDLIAQYGASDEGTMAAPAAGCMDSLRFLLADTSYDVYSVALIWGMVHPSVPPMPPIPLLVWNGGVEVNGNGFLKVMAPIDFERGQDSLIPTGTPMARAWVSQTGWDIDGLSLILAMKRGVVYVVPPELKLVTKQVAINVLVEKLEAFDTVLAVDNLNSLVIHARKLHFNPCPAGKLAGMWTRDDASRAYGHFDGTWMDGTGAPTGKVHGKFWSETDKNLFEGAYTDSTGTIIGHIKGVWRYEDPMMCATCGTRMGAFDGRIFDLDDHVQGEVHGRFGMPSPLDAPSLPFVGLWRMYCSNDAETNTSTAAN